MIENRQIMAKNIQHFMEVNGVNATDVCKACGFKQNTFSDWVNGKTYPRIDKIERMANYFGISKSLLVEERKTPVDTEEAKQIREKYTYLPTPLLENPELAGEDINTITEALKLYKKIDHLPPKRKSLLLEMIDLDSTENP